VDGDDENLALNDVWVMMIILLLDDVWMMIMMVIVMLVMILVMEELRISSLNLFCQKQGPKGPRVA
jgi:hypothetical protein